MNYHEAVAVWESLGEHDEATVREAERVLCAEQIAQQIGRAALLRLNHGFLNVLGETTDRKCGLRFLCGDMTWYVEVDLTWTDVYTVRIGSRTSGRIAFEDHHIYYDQLSDIICREAARCDIFTTDV